MKKVIIGIVVVVLALVVWLSLRGKQEDTNVNQVFAKVSEGPLVINIVESGSIKPAEQINIKSQVEGRVSILYLVPEGQHVKKGDVLVELDSSTQQDNLVNQEITVQNAQASHVQAVENLEVVRNQAKADVEKAELAYGFAKEDLIKYKDGEYPNQLNDLEGKVTLAAEELQRAKDKLAWSKKLFDEKYLSETEYKSDQLSERRCELSLVTAQNNLSLLKEYTYKREVAKLESDVSQNEMALERTRRSAKANVVQAEAQLRARELELNRQNSKLTKIKDQIAKATIVAPADGLVIYSSSNNRNVFRNTEPLQEGQEVYERQELISLPTADSFIAEIKIHETNLKKLYIGLPVRLRVDALPGEIFMGRISKIAPLPDSQSMFMNPDLKLYNTEIKIDGGTGKLKSGMNCEAEIVVEQYEKVLHVPVQCIVRENGKPVAYVKKGDGTEKREVEIGLDNNRMVRVISGLKLGDEVLLTPPLRESVSTRANEEMINADIPQRPAENQGMPGQRGMRGGKGPGGQGRPGRPQGGMPQGGMQQGGMQQGGMPQGGMPQGGMQQGGMPQGGMPQGMARPQGGMPQGGAPAGGARPQGMPQRGGAQQ